MTVLTCENVEESSEQVEVKDTKTSSLLDVDSLVCVPCVHMS